MDEKLQIILWSNKHYLLNKINLLVSLQDKQSVIDGPLQVRHSELQLMHYYYFVSVSLKINYLSVQF